MSTNLENFCPRLRPGRVIPRGSLIIFETENPYNQIVLPMALADLILLCSGQFSIRQIVEKIYRKQGAVPFKSILSTIHSLHQGGFFENGSELSLNSHLRSWMEPRGRQWHFSWRFGQRILADRRAPMAFYVVTMVLLVTSLLGMDQLPTNPLALIRELFRESPMDEVVLGLFIASSLIQTVRHCFRAVQLLLLTGRVYNVTLQLSPWGLHLHVGDEATDLFENRLHTALFHLSQIVLGWSSLFVLAQFLSPTWVQTLVLVNCWITFWELNPFVNSQGLKLAQTLMLPSEREIASWHFEASHVLKSINAGTHRQDLSFARFCIGWGTAWLMISFATLEQLAEHFAPAAISCLSQMDWSSVIAVVGVTVWFFALYSLSQVFVETLFLSVLRPWWWQLRRRAFEFWRRRGSVVDQVVVAEQISQLPLFSHFHENHLLRILKESEVTDIPANTYVLQFGETTKHLFVLLDGEVNIAHVSGSRQWSTELGGVSIFAESALLDASALSLQVVTQTASRILEIPVEIIRQVAQESHNIRKLEDFRNAILVNQFFSSSPVFRSLSQVSIDFLSNRGALEYLDANQAVFRQGDSSDSVYLILRGSVEIQVHGTRVSHLTQGAFFGEIALIANIPRTATAVAREPSMFFRISADSFWEVLVQNLDLGVFIETISESRLREDLEIASNLKPTGSDPHTGSSGVS